MKEDAQLPLKVLVACTDLGEDTVVGRATARLVSELERLEVHVVVARSVLDAESLLVAERDLHVAIADWALGKGGETATGLVEAIRRQSDDLPIFLMTGRGSVDEIPIATVRRCDGFVYLLDDTADWIAGRIRDAGERYRRAIAPPMFTGLVKFAHEHEYSWHTPGHEGGTGFRKSPVGRAFFDFFGEPMFRS
ncbi:MAG: hypothetical protein JO325_11240, partial [Solirubrobacterales bacterium]|nr:hypothetical protein [Solirubrobacterales bacterium]